VREGGASLQSPLALKAAGTTRHRCLRSPLHPALRPAGRLEYPFSPFSFPMTFIQQLRGRRRRPSMMMVGVVITRLPAGFQPLADLLARDTALLRRIDAAARRQGISRTAWLRHVAVSKALEALRPLSGIEFMRTNPASRSPASGRTSAARGWKPHAVRRTAANRIDVVTRLRGPNHGRLSAVCLG
jgi:hypothetical protein